MVMDTCVRFQILDEVPLDDWYRVFAHPLLSNVAQHLEDEAVKCGKVRPDKALTLSFPCRVQGHRILVTMGLPEESEGGSLCFSIACREAPPTLLERLFRSRRPVPDLDSAEALRRVCQCIKEALEADSRLSDFRWMSFHEWASSPAAAVRAEGGGEP